MQYTSIFHINFHKKLNTDSTKFTKKLAHCMKLKKLPCQQQQQQTKH